MSNFNIKVDLSPYLPDSYLKQNIYQTLDKVDYTSYISINSTVFVFNINCSDDEYQYYNDPGYLLYGIKKKSESNPTIYFDYKVPSTYFFNFPLIELINNMEPYKVLQSEEEPNAVIIDLIQKIGYDVSLLKYVYSTSPKLIINFSFKILECYDIISETKKIVIYLFFNIKNLTEINYNYYNSTVYFNTKYYNVFIYPFLNTDSITPIVSLNRNINLIYNKNNYTSKSTNYIKPVDFDDKDIIKYFEKIDYKYMERRNYYLNQNNKLDLLINLSKNYKLYEDYFLNSKENNNIMISNNEISKTYYSNSDYEDKNLNSYTMSLLNNNYVNNYISFSGKDKKYSFTLDGKISYVNKFLKLNQFKYSPYNYLILNTPSIYQMSKNYYVNTYINVDIEDIINSNQELLLETNSYLYKILISINPNILNALYLVSPDVKLSIYSLFNNCNQLNFGNSLDKINLFFINTFKTTETFYIDKYKIIFNFKINDFELSYIIILGICFYNGKNLNITNTTVTRNTDDLGYILFTNEENSVSLSPHLYNFNNDDVKVYEDKDSYPFYDLKYFRMLVDYNKIYANLNYKDIAIYNNYTFIPLIRPIILDYIQKTDTINDQIIYSDPNPVANLFDINVSKINNYIKNLINLSDNILGLVDNQLLLTLTNTLNYDYNLELYGNNYVYNYSYFPKIELNSFLPNTINKYKLFNSIPENSYSLNALPAGYYKVFRYKNFYPKYEFTSTTQQNDELVLTINNIKKYLSMNFLLFIKLPNNYAIDDKFVVDLNKSDKEYYLNRTNYSCNIGPSETQLFLVVSNSEGKPYINSENIIYGLKLFNLYNSSTGTNIPPVKYKIRLNLFYCTYLNFYQMVLVSTIFKNFSDSKNCLLNIDDTKLILHNRNLLKDVVYYDFIRFNYLKEDNLKIIKNQYENYDPKITDTLYDSKYYANLLKTDINRLVFIQNTSKIVIYLKKAYYYLSNYLIIETKNPLYIEIVNFLGETCLYISQINYSNGTTFSINNDYVQNLLLIIKSISTLTPFESINILIKNIQFGIYYFEDKIIQTIKQIIFDYQLIINDPTVNIQIKDEYKKINELLFIYELNILMIDEITNKINNLFTPDIIETISNNYPLIKIENIRLLVELVINFLHLISLNSKKIDELLNTVRIIYVDKTVDSIFDNTLNNRVIKNMFLYNTDYYNSLEIRNFNINQFLNDYATCIVYFSIPANNSPISYLYYVKAINENILDYINNTIKYFNLINEQIIGIYKFIYNINIGIIPKINIFNTNNISNMYYLLTLFKENYVNLTKVVIENKINIFQEFDLVIDFFNQYVNSIKDFLFYVEIKLYFENLSTFNQNIFLDVLKILEITELYSIINQIIEFINQVSLGNTTIINDFMNDVYNNIKLNDFEIKNPKEELEKFKLIIQNYNYENKNIYSILKKYIINSYIITNNIVNLDGIITNITYQGQEIVIIRDYNILYLDLSNSSFNFNSELINIVKNSIDYQINILDYYYAIDSLTYNLFYKQLINYNFLDIKYLTSNANNFDDVV